MNVRVIGFIAPVVGVDGEFNTFRLGGFYKKCLSPEEEVFLLSEKDRLIFGRARVERIEFGSLGDILQRHAFMNHTELKNDPIGAPDRLGETMRKIYGPHIATLAKKTTVIYLRRIE